MFDNKFDLIVRNYRKMKKIVMRFIYKKQFSYMI